jgi:Cu/Ag efflux pump CusA
MNRIADVIEQQILSVPEVRKVGRRLGRAERGDHVVPVSTAEFDVDFRDTEDAGEGVSRPRREILDEIGKRVRAVPGIFAVVGGPLADRIGHMLSGVSAPVAVKIFGPDLDCGRLALRSRASRAASLGFRTANWIKHRRFHSSVSRRTGIVPRPMV